MTKNVLITISGLHYDESALLPEEDNESIEVMAPALYYFKNGKHYILYEEPVEGMPGTIKNTIKIKEGEMLEIVKSGLANTRMVFEKEKINITPYEVPYGEIMVGIYTTQLDVKVQERQIDVYVRYSLDVNGEKLAECNICMKVEAKDG